MGRLLVLDGLDGSGKFTQTNILENKFGKKNVKFTRIDYPNYCSKSSTLVKLYLNGEIATSVFDVNCYAASVFFACDHYVSYLKNWKQNYDSGELILANRYVSSNAIHQMAKLAEIDWDDYLNWLYDFEFKKLGLPLYDELIYLDLLPEISQNLIANRNVLLSKKSDLHEQSLNYLNKCRQAAFYCVKKFKWNVVKCFVKKELLSIDEVAEKIENLVENFKFFGGI